MKLQLRTRKTRYLPLAHAAVLGVMLAFSGPAAQAVEVGGVKLDDTVKLADKELRLNGAGIRTKVVFKVYAAGLYLSEKKTTTADVLALAGPRRVALVLLRDVSSADFSESFTSGINSNSDKADLAKVSAQIAKFGGLFGSIPGVKKGDVINMDWIPGTGTLVSLNGKPLGDPLPDVIFNNAVLKIWLGEQPADTSLKPLLLGGK